jgi:hypothetical protein
MRARVSAFASLARARCADIRRPCPARARKAAARAGAAQRAVPTAPGDPARLSRPPCSRPASPPAPPAGHGPTTPPQALLPPASPPSGWNPRHPIARLRRQQPPRPQHIRSAEPLQTAAPWASPPPIRSVRDPPARPAPRPARGMNQPPTRPAEVVWNLTCRTTSPSSPTHHRQPRRARRAGRQHQRSADSLPAAQGRFDGRQVDPEEWSPQHQFGPRKHAHGPQWAGTATLTRRT